MKTPPATSVSDCIVVIAASLALGLLHYLVFRHMYRRSPAQVGEMVTSQHSHFRSPVLFLVSWFPWLLFALGSIGVSVLRDHGFTIFPWPIVANSMLLCYSLCLALRLQSRYISRTDTTKGAQDFGT
jgi:hypothetical protein